MFGLNGNRQQVSDLIFGFIDSFLVLAAIFLSVFLRCHNNSDADYFLGGKLAVLRVMLLVFLIQIGFYFFDLFNPTLYHEQRKKMVILFFASLGVSFLLASFIYFLIPSLAITRAMLALGLFLAFVLSFTWRLLYTKLFDLKTFTEKVLIIGTGQLAKKIETEISTNKYSGFEIVGFLDEDCEKIRERI